MELPVSQRKWNTARSCQLRWKPSQYRKDNIQPQKPRRERAKGKTQQEGTGHNKGTVIERKRASPETPEERTTDRDVGAQSPATVPTILRQSGHGRRDTGRGAQGGGRRARSPGSQAARQHRGARREKEWEKMTIETSDLESVRHLRKRDGQGSQVLRTRGHCSRKVGIALWEAMQQRWLSILVANPIIYCSTFQSMQHLPTHEASNAFPFDWRALGVAN